MKLPDSWAEMPLADICVLNPRLSSDARPDEMTEVTFVPMSAVDEKSGTISKPEIRTFGEVSKGYTNFLEKDVLFAKVTPCMENGKAAIAGTLLNGLGFGSTEFHVLRPTGLVLSEYIFHFIRQEAFRDRAASAFVGTGGLQRVPLEFLSRIKLPLPPLPEQQRIVDVLRQAEVVSGLICQANELFAQLGKQRFIEMFGHPAENQKGFKSALLHTFGTLDRGVSKHRPRDASHLIGGSYPFIQTGDVSNAGDWITSHRATYSEAGLAQSKLWPKGTLCITIAANIAKAAILEFDACFPDSVVGFTPRDGVSSEYVLYCLRFYQEYFEHRAPKSAQMNINLDTLRTLRIPKPPEALQVEFAQFVREGRLLSNIATQSKDQQVALTQELKALAFSGELTANWRENHQASIAKFATSRDTLLRERGAAIVSIGSKSSVHFTEYAPLERRTDIPRPRRQALIDQLSSFQHEVWNMLRYEWRGAVLADDLVVFGDFCTNPQTAWRLEGFDAAPINVRRALEQLATMGLVRKFSLPQNDPSNETNVYLTAFRPLREDKNGGRAEEDVALADVAAVQAELKRREKGGV